MCFSLLLRVISYNIKVYFARVLFRVCAIESAQWSDRLPFSESVWHALWLAKYSHAGFGIDILPDLVGGPHGFFFINIGESLMEKGIRVLECRIAEQLETLNVPVSYMLFFCVNVDGEIEEITNQQRRFFLT